MDEHQGIYRLIEKVETGLPEIKVRSITSLHTKITIGIIETEILPKFKKMPGALLNWINDNSTRSQNLFKVLTILSYFTKSQDGLVLLQQYQATDFFKQLRSFLLSQNPKQDQYTNILETMIKALLPLHPQTPSQSELQSSNIPLQQSKVKEKEPIQTQNLAQKKKKEDLVLSWVVSKDFLGKKEEDQLYSLYMEFRHGKRQLHLEWLTRIHELVKYWGYKSFRFKNDLISELQQQFPKSKLKWLIIEIIRSLFRSLSQHSQHLKQGRLDLVNVNYPKPLSPPEEEIVKIKITPLIFESIYSAPLLKDILSFTFAPEKQQQIEQWILGLCFKHTPAYFIESFRRLIEKEWKEINLSTINKQIQFYCHHFPQSRTLISDLINSIPQNWNLQASDFPILISYLQQNQNTKAYHWISKYDSEWSLGENLHLINEVMSNLTKGVSGVDHKTKKHQIIFLYLKCLFTLGIAVEKQDPLMTHYPTMKNLIIEIASNKNVRTTFFEESLTAFNSHVPLKYGSKSYICSQLAQMIFAEDSLFLRLFKEALNEQQSCACWLQIMKRLVLTHSIENLDRYLAVLYCLTYHKNNQIKQISKYLVEKMNEKGQLKLLLCRLFSTSQEERSRVCLELFPHNRVTIMKALDGNPPEKLVSSKKLLKIQGQTLNNYIKIIFNTSLEAHIHLSAASQLKESVQRIQFNQQIIDILVMLSVTIQEMLEKRKESLDMSLVSMLIQTKELIDFRTNFYHPFSIPTLGILLEQQKDIKTIKILLRAVYSQVFQNPFSENKQFHFTFLLYPALKLMSHPISEPILCQPSNSMVQSSQNKVIDIPNYKQTKQLEHFGFYAFFKLINNEKVILDQIFADIVEKQLGQIIHASKGYLNLHYLSYLIVFLKQNKVQLSQRVCQYSAPLLSSLLAKEIAPYSSESAAQLLSLIGSKRNRQLLNLINNGSSGTWKLHLFSGLSNVGSQSLEPILRNLLNINYGREAAFTLKSLLPFLKTTQVNEFSQSLIRNSCIKYFRQDGDIFLRKIALYVLTQLYGGVNLPQNGESELFSSLTAVITQQHLPLEILTFALNLIKKIVLKDSRVLSQGSLLKLLISRLIPLSSHPSIEHLLQATVLELFRVVLNSERQDLLAGADLIDISLPLFSLLQKVSVIKDPEMRVLIAAADILFLSCQNQSDLPKYLLSSTSLQIQLLACFELKLQGQSLGSFLQAISRLWVKLSTIEEDLFVYKMSQIVSHSKKSLMDIISTYIKDGKIQYLKMLCWTVVIWSKNRQKLEESFSMDLSLALLESSQPELIKMILPFSLKAKEIFLNSPLITQTIKQVTSIVEARIVKQTKEKKKKGKLYCLQQDESLKVQKCFELFNALFYFDGQGQIEGGQGIRKVLIFLQRFYLAGAWEESVMKHFLKVMTNMGISLPMSDSVAARMAQSGTFVEQISNCLIRSQKMESSRKLALKLASSLVNVQSFRIQLLRCRVIQQLSSKLIKSQQKNELSLEYTSEVVELFLSFSAYKDSNTRILGDKRLGDILLQIMRAGKFSILEEKIAKLLANIACFKLNKNTLMNCRQLHKTVLGLLQDPEITYRSSLLSLLYNLLYKNAAALKLYRRPEVIQLIQTVRKSEGESVQEVTSALLEVLQGQQGL